MLDDIRAALSEAAQPYSDTRLHHCRVEAAALDGNRCTLAGAVLDSATLHGLLAALAARLPEVAFDASAVRALVGPATPRLAVATNLTGLYAGPSFLAEQVSQLLNGWPVEELMTEGRWAFVRQADGYLGWAYRPYLAAEGAPAATHLICEPVSLLRAGPAADAALVSRALGGTAAAVTAAAGSWAQVALAGGCAGWLPAAELRSLDALPQEAAARRDRIIDDARRFTGVPYLWGGCSALGIDCSGLAQLTHRLAGVTLPRDADMQFDAGRPIEAPFAPGDLLFFGELGERRSITHVGISLGGWRIIHSSRSRNGVYEDDVQAVDHLRESFVGARSFV